MVWKWQSGEKGKKLGKVKCKEEKKREQPIPSISHASVECQ